MRNKAQQKHTEDPGHLDPARAKSLLEMSARTDRDPDQRGFLAGAGALRHDELAEELAESFLESATKGEPMEPERLDRVTDLDRGGPFVVTTGQQEFARGTDEMNPEDAEREPFPTPNRVAREG